MFVFSMGFDTFGPEWLKNRGKKKQKINKQKWVVMYEIMPVINQD